MRISQDVRRYAEERGPDDADALQAGMREKAAEYVVQGFAVPGRWCPEGGAWQLPQADVSSPRPRGSGTRRRQVVTCDDLEAGRTWPVTSTLYRLADALAVDLRLVGRQP